MSRVGKTRNRSKPNAKTLRAIKDVEKKTNLRFHKNVQGLLKDLKK